MASGLAAAPEGTASPSQADGRDREAAGTEVQVTERTLMSNTNDNQLVFTLPEALSEIRVLRDQKAILIEALEFVSERIGGTIGEKAAGALVKVESTKPAADPITAMDKILTVEDVEAQRFTRMKHGHTMADRSIATRIATEMHADDLRDAEVMLDRTKYTAGIRAVLLEEPDFGDFEDSDYCECGAIHGEEELDGICAACGKLTS
jgi:hypothetical protein